MTAETVEQNVDVQLVYPPDDALPIHQWWRIRDELAVQGVNWMIREVDLDSVTETNIRQIRPDEFVFYLPHSANTTGFWVRVDGYTGQIPVAIASKERYVPHEDATPVSFAELACQLARIESPVDGAGSYEQPDARHITYAKVILAELKGILEENNPLSEEGRPLSHSVKHTFDEPRTADALNWVREQAQERGFDWAAQVGAAIAAVYPMLFLSEAVAMAVGKITHGVFYPVFSRVRHDGHERLRDVYYRTRIYTDAAAMTSTGCLVVLGDWIVQTLYDERYAMAGWMLQALCVRVAMNCILLPCETCLFSLGHTRYGFYQNIARSSWVLIGIPLAWHVWQLEGIIWITALSEVPVLLVLWPAFARVGMLRIGAELRGVAFFGMGAVLGYGLLQGVQVLGWR
jgi:hypothetical protein